jgi:periplasmic protein TonB
MDSWEDDSEKRTFIRRYGAAIGFMVGLAVLAALAFLGTQIFGSHSGPAKVEQITIVKLLPPLPTPPPTPPPQIQPQPTVQQMIEQQQMMEPETKPEKEQKRDEPPKAHEKAPGPLGLNAKGEGAGDAFGLVGKPGGNGLFGNGGGGGGSRWGWYAGEVQARVEEALQKNSRTRTAALRVEVRIWPDTTGRITRVELAGSTGDPALDAAIRGQVLTGLQLQEPPPAGMPLPIVMRLTERRPN